MRKVLVLVTCCFALSACATTGGVRVEGAAAQVTPPPSTPPPPSNVTPSVDAIALLRTDPKVSDNIKALLTPCVQDHYPVDTRYADVTEDGALDLIVTVSTCDTKLPGLDLTANLAGYVYNLKTTPPTDILAIEQPWLNLEVADSGLYLLRYQFGPREKTCCLSQPVTQYYHWNGTELVPLKK